MTADDSPISFTDAVARYGLDAVIAGVEAMGPDGVTAASGPPPTLEGEHGADGAFADVEVRRHEIDGPGGRVPARHYEPRHADGGASLVWVHGGAYLFGDLDMLEAHWVGLALASRGVTVVTLDYRKCLHGVHFPAPSDDVLAGWRWAGDLLGGAGVAPGALSLGGASAGASLAAGAAKRLRDAGEPLPASLVLAYPGAHAVPPPLTDELRAALDEHPPTERFDGEIGVALRRHLVGPSGSLDDPYAFPAEGDLRGLPPTFILNSEYDGLRASGELFGRQLADAGVAVLVETEPGAEHGHLGRPDLPGGPRSIERIAAWLESRAQGPG